MNQNTNRVQGLSLEELAETESNGRTMRSQSFNNLGGVSPRKIKDIYTIDESNSFVLSSPNNRGRGISQYNDAMSSNRNNVTHIVSEGPKNLAARASFRESER